jgi:hypothetical protein
MINFGVIYSSPKRSGSPTKEFGFQDNTGAPIMTQINAICSKKNNVSHGNRKSTGIVGGHQTTYSPNNFERGRGVANQQNSSLLN